MSAQLACATGLAESAQELVENTRLQFFRADVIEKKKRPRAEDGDVVDTMIHQIGADGVVFVHGEGDFQFRADAIDAGDEHRLAAFRENSARTARQTRRFFRAPPGRAFCGQGNEFDA